MFDGRNSSFEGAIGILSSFHVMHMAHASTSLDALAARLISFTRANLHQ